MRARACAHAHVHIHPLNSQTAEKMLYKPSEKRFLKRHVVRFFFKEERDGELRTVVKREPKIWATLKWKDLCIFEVSLGDFQQFVFVLLFY